jgi:transglutaminase-like putative cysteine protease
MNVFIGVHTDVSGVSAVSDNSALDSQRSHESSAALSEVQWLRSTQQLDLDHGALRIQARKLTQLLAEPSARAMAVHDFVKSLPFETIPDFICIRASDVLRQGAGDCHAKGMLFVALLRAAGVPARLRFVTLSTRFLNGLIDTGAASMTHAVGEVWLHERWVQTDTYVVDAAMERQARAMLMRRSMRTGYGVHLDAHQQWNGIDDAHAQYTPQQPDSMPVVDWGVAHDARHFYADASHASLRHSFAVRVKWLLGAQIVNRKVQQLRHGNV